MDEHVRNFRSWAEFSPEVEQQIREQRPVTSLERELASDRKEKLLRDSDWIDRYNKGGRKERTEMFLVNLILSSRVRDAA
jgi:hypothetical protein